MFSHCVSQDGDISWEKGVGEAEADRLMLPGEPWLEEEEEPE